MKSYKGVSPLIASVLLIAFTMAIAAVLTAWISSFTTAQKEKTAVFEEKINCNYGFIENDIDFTVYNSSSGLFQTRVKNTGTQDLSLGKYQVWYSGVAVPTMWVLNNPINTSIKKQDAIMVVLNMSKDGAVSATNPLSIDKVKLVAYICDGVTTTISQPLGGWASGNPDSTKIIPAKPA